MEQLEKRPSPIEIVRFSSSRLIFSSQIDLPEYSSWLIDYPLTDDKYERYLNLIDELELEVDHKLLGHSNKIQKGMELQCELVRNNLYCGSAELINDPRVVELVPGRVDWQLLFQISSYDEDDVHWANDGTLYFWIRTEALKAKRFEQAWQILQSF